MVCVCCVWGGDVGVCWGGGGRVGISFGMGFSLPGGAGHSGSHYPSGWCTDRAGCNVYVRVGVLCVQVIGRLVACCPVLAGSLSW